MLTDSICTDSEQRTLKPSTISAPTWQLPAPARQLPAPTRELPAPTRQLPAHTRQLPAPTRQLPVPTRELPAPTRQLPVPTRELPRIRVRAAGDALLVHLPGFRGCRDYRKPRLHLCAFRTSPCLLRTRRRLCPPEIQNIVRS